MTILSADILDRDRAGADVLRACLATDRRYAHMRALASRREKAHRPFPLSAPARATLHAAAATLVLASAGAASLTGAFPAG